MLASGFLGVIKPPGMSSSDVCTAWRRRTGLKVGHLGTLDPGAAGVLVLAVGAATRLVPYVAGWDKEYVAEAWFGVQTDTDDRQGRVLDSRDAAGVTRTAVEELLPRFTGEILQRPPRVAAVKVQGQPLYRRLRQGEEPAVPARRVRVRSLRLLEFVPGRVARARLEVVCGAGTYVRSLVRDLGEALGVGGTVAFLVRTRVGPFAQDRCLLWEEAEAAWERGAWPDGAWLEPAAALAHLPALWVSARQARQVAHGQGTHLPPSLQDLPVGQHLRIMEGERLVAVGQVTCGGVRVLRVVGGGEEHGG